jgi:hypothetical protein
VNPFLGKGLKMAEMNVTMVQSNRKKGPAVDVGAFAEHIEDQANRLADSGWAHEATHLRKWATELKGKSGKSEYAGDRLQKSPK